MKKIQPKQKSQVRQIPYDSLIGISVIQPILDKDILNSALEAIVPFTNQTRWEKWGLSKIKKQGGAILLKGLGGTGKTTLARWLAKKIGKGIINITMADIGGSDPGETERHSRALFQFAIKQNFPVVFFDECDAILWSRDKAGPDSMWMLGVVNELLMQIEQYKGLVVLATNMPHFLDSALSRRIIAEITLPIPDVLTRYYLWEQKIPQEFPLQLNDTELNQISRYHLTGALIENVIIKEAQAALRQNRNPKFASLCNIAKQLEIKQ